MKTEYFKSHVRLNEQGQAKSKQFENDIVFSQNLHNVIFDYMITWSNLSTDEQV